MVNKSINYDISKGYTDDEAATVLRKALLRVVELFKLSQKQVAKLLGVSEASISRLYDNKRQILSHSKEGELALLLIRIYRSLDALLGGNEKQCRDWFHAENTYLGQTPCHAVQSITGMVKVADYLDAMRGKT